MNPADSLREHYLSAKPVLRGWLHMVAAPIAGAAAVLLIHATTMYVYTYLLVRAALATFDPALLEAATALGASRWRAIRTIVLPLLRPAIGNGALLTALSSLASFSAPPPTAPCSGPGRAACWRSSSR